MKLGQFCVSRQQRKKCNAAKYQYYMHIRLLQIELQSFVGICRFAVNQTLAQKKAKKQKHRVAQSIQKKIKIANQIILLINYTIGL